MIYKLGNAFINAHRASLQIPTRQPAQRSVLNCYSATKTLENAIKLVNNPMQTLSPDSASVNAQRQDTLQIPRATNVKRLVLSGFSPIFQQRNVNQPVLSDILLTLSPTRALLVARKTPLQTPSWANVPKIVRWVIIKRLFPENATKCVQTEPTQSTKTRRARQPVRANT